jgi:ankyrin repeat protein
MTDVISIIYARLNNAKDNNGRTPLTLATHNGHEDVAETLRQQGGHE